MFTALYFYRVPKNNVDAFLAIQKKASEIYKKYGAIEDWTFGPSDLSEKYGCSSFMKEIVLDRDESLYFSLSLFESKEAHERIMIQVDADPEIETLYREISRFVDVSRVIRGEFNRVV